MSQQTKNSCAKAFGNRSRNKNLRPKKSRGGGQIDPPLCLLGLIISFYCLDLNYMFNTFSFILAAVKHCQVCVQCYLS